MQTLVLYFPHLVFSKTEFKTSPSTTSTKNSTHSSGEDWGLHTAQEEAAGYTQPRRRLLSEMLLWGRHQQLEKQYSIQTIKYRLPSFSLRVTSVSVHQKFLRGGERIILPSFMYMNPTFCIPKALYCGTNNSNVWCFKDMPVLNALLGSCGWLTALTYPPPGSCTPAICSHHAVILQ